MILIKYVSLTIMAMAENCAPFIVMVLAYLILGETTSFLQIIATVISVIGALIVVYGANHETKK